MSMKGISFLRTRQQLPSLWQKCRAHRSVAQVSSLPPPYMQRITCRHQRNPSTSFQTDIRQLKVQAISSHRVTAMAGAQLRRRVRHIIVPQNDPALLTDLQDQLEGGAKFEELAREHSLCPSAQKGGDLGWLQRGMGLPDMLEEAIFDAEIKETFTADSRHGVHILQVLDERAVAQMEDMHVSELAALLEQGPEAAQFIDVREPGEHAIASLPHFELLPLSRFQEWGPHLREKYDTEKETVCLCHAGMRSRSVASMLLEQGFTKVYNVSGGIDAYSCLIDEKVPRY